MGEAELAAEVTGVMGYCCASKGNKESTIAGKLVAVQLYHEQFVGLSFPLGKPLIRPVKARNQEGARREGYAAESENATDVGYADKNARKHTLLGGGGKGGMDRLGVVLFSDVAGIRIVCPGKRGSFTVFIVRGGGMWRFSEIMRRWGKAGGRRRIK